MTRINVIPPAELTRQHLLAEYRELPRVFKLVEKFVARGYSPEQLSRHGQPTSYTLGKGHVLFFYDKLSFLAERQQQLIDEMLKRGYRPTFTDRLSDTYRHLPKAFWGAYRPTVQAKIINRQRIKERLNGS